MANPTLFAGTVQEISIRNFYKDGLIDSENKLNALLDMTEGVVCEVGARWKIRIREPKHGTAHSIRPS
ncbi:MAG: hypothetical protein R3B51_00610 [Thermodesulfobacteriota bacterium]